ncbi:MAG: cation:proton antiporter [Kofleriaceae bacterium]
MFSLGLEFSLRKLLRVGPTAGITALLECSVMVSTGYLIGSALGWTRLESIFAGAIIAISSTTIIARAFAEYAVAGRLRELVVGILVVEDLIAILLMAVLTAIASGHGLSAGSLAATVGQLGAFLAGVVVVGLLVVPPAMRAIVKLGRRETTLVASVGLCFAVALLAQELGYSVALGAFLAGSLVAESGVEAEVEHLIEPVRDVFAAIFFVAVGMLIDPQLIAEHWVAVVALAAAVLVGKVVAVSLGAFITGNGIPTSVRAGMSLAQIGEFSFIIAGLGTSLAAVGAHLYPIAVAVSAITTLTTPWFIRGSLPVARWVDRRLPAPLQTFAALYASWIERLRATAPEASVRRDSRRLVIAMVIDAAALIAIVIGTSLAYRPVREALSEALGLSAYASTAVVFAGVGLLSLPFLLGLVGLARRLGNTLATAALPAARPDGVDLSAAPRRAMIIVIELAVLALVGVPIVASTLPFVPRGGSAALLVILLGVLAVVFWRRANDLQGHVRAGAEVIIEALGNQIRRGAAVDAGGGGAARGPEPTAEEELAQLAGLLPGLGDPSVHRLAPDAHAVGQTLASLNLRGATGATVLAIGRPARGAFVPGPTEILAAADLLALAGSHDAVTRAKALLDGGPTAPALDAEADDDASHDLN